MNEVANQDPEAPAQQPLESGEGAPAARPRIEKILLALLAIAVLYTLYFAKTLLLPMVVALLFALLLSPLVGAFKKFHVPRTVSALILLVAIGGPLTLLGMQLAEPAKKWVTLLPELSAGITEQIESFQDVLQAEPEPPRPESEQETESRWYNIFGFFSDDDKAESSAEQQGGEDPLSLELMQGGLELTISLVAAIPGIVAQFLVGVILSMFLLIFGPRLYESFLETLPQVKDKEKALQLVGRVQSELSHYIFTVSAINLALGVTVAGALWLLGVDDALLWGAMVGLLNFAPYVGPLIALCVLAMAGMVQYGLELAALLPAVVYFLINMVEAQFVTPTVLGQRMQLNPLVVMVWLILWGWLWGGGGVLLAVPLLVCIKLAAEESGLLSPWLKLVETRA
jgi:predicted PurR-regulated permease PerM